MDFYDFKFKDITGKEIDLTQNRGKVTMVVNTASGCGFTPQYKNLEKLYQEFRNKGFEIIAVPSNQFGNQEPLAGNQIKEFCEINYGVSFKVTDKTDVIGEKAHPFFKKISSSKSEGGIGISPKWNFQKYIIDKKGRVRDFYLPFTKPDSWRVKRKIEKLLEE